jgi:arylsulfatase A-like enzyme
MAEAMRDAGYATAAFITNVNAGVQNNNDQGFDFFYDQGPALTGDRGLRTLPEEEVLSWLDMQKHRPFFAYIHTSEPHAPYEPPDPWSKAYDPEYTGPMTGVRTGPHGLLEASDSRDIEHARALYDGEISFADFQFGRFLDALRTRGMLDETLIIVISDHGEELHDHGGWNHGRTLYQELLRVPIILGGDSRIRTGLVSESYVGLVDIMPTVLGWAQAEMPETAEGVNLLTVAESVGGKEARTIFAENYYPGHETLAMVENGKKVIYNITPRQAGQVEFYNLALDKSETQNLADSESAYSMLARLKAFQQEKAGQYAGMPEEKALDPETYERLKALGYID